MLFASHKNIISISNGDKDDTSLRQLCAYVMSYKDLSQVMMRNGASCE